MCSLRGTVFPVCGRRLLLAAFCSHSEARSDNNRWCDLDGDPDGPFIYLGYHVSDVLRLGRALGMAGVPCSSSSGFALALFRRGGTAGIHWDQPGVDEPALVQPDLDRLDGAPGV